MYSCVAVVVALFAWGGVVRHSSLCGVVGGVSGTAMSGSVRPWRPRVRRAAPRRRAANEVVEEGGLPAALHLPIFYGTVLLSHRHRHRRCLRGHPSVVRRLRARRVSLYVVFEGVLDLAGLALVIGIGIAMWRRFVMKPEYITSRLSTERRARPGCSSWGSPGLAWRHRIAAQPNEWAAAAFVGWSVAQLVGGVSTNGSAVGLPGGLVAARGCGLQPHHRPGVDRILTWSASCPPRSRLTTQRPSAHQAHHAVRPDRGGDGGSV